jgi:Collagen triple helix repeat (20 copies)
MQRLRGKLTYANVMATVAVFLVLGGGAYAATAIPPNSVGTRQLKNNSVTGAKVKDGSLLAKDFGTGQLPAGAQGPAGAAGPRGETGATGATGPEGDAGPTGARGEVGDEGPRGLTGAPGEEGTTGPRGRPGAEGEEGPQGERGREGREGPEGPAGAKGERGLRGEVGPQGEPGEEGPEGEAGKIATLTRYGKEQAFARGPLASYASCRKGETVTGGGFDVLGFPGTATYNVRADRASLAEELSEEEFSEEVEEELEAEGVVFSRLDEREEESEEEVPVTIYRAPKEGGTATGWAASLESFGKLVPKATFRAYVECAPPQ